MTQKLERLEQPVKIAPVVLGLIYLTVALLAVSFAAILIRLSEQEIGPSATVFNRLWIAALVFGLWDRLSLLLNPTSENLDTTSSPFNTRDYWLLVGVASVSTASVVCWAWSLTQTSVANSTILRNLTPLFTTLGGWILLNRRFDRRFLLGMVVAVCGAIAIEWDDWQIAGDRVLGDCVALLSALFYAAYLLLVEHLRGKLSTTTILLWRCGMGALLLLPFVLAMQEQLFPETWQGWLAVIALGIVCQVIGQGLLVHCLQQFSSSFIALFLLLEPILTAAFAWVIFAEQLSWWNGLAFGVVLIGIYLAKSSHSDKN